MSSAHHRPHDLKPKELDDLLDEALADPRIKHRLSRPYKLVTSYDIALLGSSSVGGRNVYLDRHLKGAGMPYGVIPVKGKRLDVKPGLIRHERLEQALEDIFGWSYLPLAHNVAQRWEERDYRAKGFDPKDVEAAFKPFIKADAVEKIERTPTDLDQRPLYAPPKSDKLIAHVNATAQKEKLPHQGVAYVDKSPSTKRQCGKCAMFVEGEYGGPLCTLVKSPIVAGGYCRRFVPGKLEDWHGRDAVSAG